jgi:predicted transcriptional regulator YdeE
MAEWLPQSGYKMAESPVFICSDSGRPDSPDAAWRIHIPLEKPGELEQLKHWIA